MMQSFSLIIRVALTTIGMCPPILAQDAFYATENVYIYPRLFRLDAQSGQVIYSNVVTGAFVARSLTHDGQRLFSIDGLGIGIPETLFAIRPADARVFHLMPAGFDWNWWSIDIHPLTGDMYAVCQQQLYVFDKTTGVAQLIGPITHNNPHEFLISFAISPSGRAYTTGSWVWELDLDTADVQFIGSIDAGGFEMITGSFLDLAFNSAGELWGSYSDAFTNTKNGLYKIELQTMTAVMMAPKLNPYGGLAFGPSFDGRTYCVSSPSRAGCEPLIQGEGVPTPTAPSGYEISVADIQNQSMGLLLLGTRSEAQVPFQGGTLCLTPPMRRTPVANAGGSPTSVTDCSGAFSLDFNTYMTQHETVQVGATMYCQWWGRDPLDPAGSASQLSNGLAFLLVP